MSGHDRAVGIIWTVGVLVLLAAFVAGGIQVFADFSAEMAFRWVMALMFLGGSLAWLTAYHHGALRRFFRR